jgi:hypothetical protein
MDADDVTTARRALVGQAMCALRANGVAEAKQFLAQLRGLDGAGKSFADSAALGAVLAGGALLSGKADTARQVCQRAVVLCTGQA